jgi:hypothetical protein
MGQTYRPLDASLSPHVAGLVATCLEADDLTTLRRSALAMFDARVGFDDGHYVPIDASFFDEAPAYLAAFVKDPSYASDLRPAVAVAGESGTYIDTEVYSSRDRDRLRLFAELLRPAGIASQLVALVRRGGRVVGVVHLNRHGRSRPFGASDLGEVVVARCPGASTRHRWGL